MHSYVARVIQPEEYAAMSNEELLEQVKAGLYVDELWQMPISIPASGLNIWSGPCMCAPSAA